MDLSYGGFFRKASSRSPKGCQFAGPGRRAFRRGDHLQILSAEHLARAHPMCRETIVRLGRRQQFPVVGTSNSDELLGIKRSVTSSLSVMAVRFLVGDGRDCRGDSGGDCFGHALASDSATAVVSTGSFVVGTISASSLSLLSAVFFLRDLDVILVVAVVIFWSFKLCFLRIKLDDFTK